MAKDKRKKRKSVEDGEQKSQNIKRARSQSPKPSTTTNLKAIRKYDLKSKNVCKIGESMDLETSTSFITQVLTPSSAVSIVKEDQKIFKSSHFKIEDLNLFQSNWMLKARVINKKAIFN